MMDNGNVIYFDKITLVLLETCGNEIKKWRAHPIKIKVGAALEGEFRRFVNDQMENSFLAGYVVRLGTRSITECVEVGGAIVEYVSSHYKSYYMEPNDLLFLSGIDYIYARARRKSKMKKIVINSCYGGFSLSHKGFLRLRELGCQAALAEEDFGEEYSDGSGIRERMGSDRFDNMFHLQDLERDDPLLIQLVGEMGDEVNGGCAKLKVIEIPDNVEWEIEEHDGNEHVAEVHKTWE